MGIIVLIKRDMKVQQKRICDMSNFKHNLDNSLSAIGAITTVSLNATTIPSGTTGNALTSITLERGKYIVIGHVRFSKNSNGVRSMSVHGTSGWNSSHVITNALADFPTLLHYSYIQNVGYTPTTMYLNVWQNSGVDLTCDAGYLQAIKISQ